MAILLEIVCENSDDCRSAENAGADRIELCSATSLGGLTPSPGSLLTSLQACSIPLACMVRPRAGGFAYSDAELTAMAKDIGWLVKEGASYVVFGVLQPSRDIDVDACARLVDAAEGTPCVFHRAFDLVPTPLKGLETLMGLGFVRVLTSGGKRTAMEGSECLRSLRVASGGRIEIMAGGKVRAENLPQIRDATRCTCFHAAAWRTELDPSIADGVDVSFGDDQSPPERETRVVDEAMVRAMRSACDAPLT